jgi:uncharacterized Zn-binding protein involved in type VI secretion
MHKVGLFSVFSFLILSLAILFFSVPSVNADGILGTDLATFSVLGAATVTNTGATTLTGNLGVSPGLAITGESTITVNGTNAATIGNPFVHAGDVISGLAQSQLATAKTELGSLGAGTLLPANLAGLTLSPGVYTVPAGTSNLTGTLTLNGQGNLNAFWVFQMPSTLITSPGSVVKLINTGAGAGLFWNVGSSATLDTTTSFEGNILALTSITLNTGATDQCGRALAHTGAVTMDTNTLSIGCTNLLGGGTGIGGGLGWRLDRATGRWHSNTSTREHPGTRHDAPVGSGLASFCCLMRMKR